MKRLNILSLFLALGLTLPAWLPAHAHASSKSHFPVTIVDDHGNRVQIAHRPTRIVSLDPRDTEMLFALGDEKYVVGDSGQYDEGAQGISRSFRYPSEWPSPWGRDYPVRSKRLPHVEGGYSSATPYNLETIESLRPDLIVAPWAVSQESTYAKLRQLGLTVIIDDPASINGILHDIRTLGVSTGAVKHATTVTTNMTRSLKAVEKRIRSAHGRPRVYYEIDATNPTQPWTAGNGTYIDQVIKLAGGKNIGDAIRTCGGKDCYAQMDLEAIVQLNPQIIVLGDAYSTPAETPATVKTRGGWETISAVRSGKIYRFDDELVSRAGPRIVVGLTRLARLIHPAVFKHP